MARMDVKQIVADTLRTLMGASAAEPYIRAIDKAIDEANAPDDHGFTREEREYQAAHPNAAIGYKPDFVVRHLRPGTSVPCGEFRTASKHHGQARRSKADR